MNEAVKKKILLIIPYEDVEEKFHVKRKVIYPLEPGIVVSILQDHAFEVRGLDLNLEFHGEHTLALLEDTIHEYDPDVVLIMSQHLTFLIKDQYQIISQIIGTIRKIDTSRSKILVAGPVASLYPGLFFKNDCPPDIIFRGEIEDQVVDIINMLNEQARLKTISGVCLQDSQDHNEAFIANEIHFIENISALPIANRDIFPLERYFDHPETGNLRYPEKGGKFTQMTATRGCNTGCTFCKVKGLRGKYRWREIEHIIAEIKFLIQEKGIEEINFLDENLLLNRTKAKQFLRRIIAENLKFHWFCGGGMAVYTLDKELLDLLKASGCYRLHLAIESGSQRVLSEVMKKPVKLHKALDMIEYARELDFEIIGYFMIGLPTETREEVLKTAEFAKNPYFDYIVFSIYTPEKGTALYDYCVEHRLLDINEQAYNLSKRSESNLLFTDEYKEFLIDIRRNMWKEINFSDPARKQKIAQMFGEVRYE